MKDPNFWDNQRRAQKIVQKVKRLKNLTEPVEELEEELEELQILTELGEEEDDEDTLKEVSRRAGKLQKSLDRVEMKAMLSEPEDSSDAYLSVQAGAGGTESCDWAQMLLRMYSGWAEEEGYDRELVESRAGEEAGIKNATMKVSGDFAYGYLKSERGVHRLVRISPFDSSGRRHTSFVAVDVVPEIEDDLEVELDDNDLNEEFMRSSGPGGQHVNRTASAVRLTHEPTGITVRCQSERSQHKNRRIARDLLKSKLYQQKKREREKELDNMYDDKGQISWGNQIRSYVLEPYQMVKDNRTDHETGKVEDVLEGDITPFMEAYLRWKLEQKTGAADD